MTETSTRARMSIGMARLTLTRSIMKKVHQPSRYPEIVPKNVPRQAIRNAQRIVTQTTENPAMSWERMSLP